MDEWMDIMSSLMRSGDEPTCDEIGHSSDVGECFHCGIDMLYCEICEDELVRKCDCE